MLIRKFVLFAFTLLAVSAKVYKINLDDEKAAKILKQKTLAVKVGDQVLLTVQENPTTGYLWIVNKDVTELSQPFYSIIKDDYKQDTKKRFIVGAGGRRTIVLTFLKKGQTHLEMVNERPWVFSGFTKGINRLYDPAQYYNIKIKID